jgi:hypothetical protein
MLSLRSKLTGKGTGLDSKPCTSKTGKFPGITAPTGALFFYGAPFGKNMDGRADKSVNSELVGFGTFPPSSGIPEKLDHVFRYDT